MPNVINKMIVRELSDAFSSAEGLLVVSLAGLSVAESDALRTALSEEGVRIQMVRSRLARLALSQSGIEAPEGMLLGNVAVAWGGAEVPIQAAKVVSKSDARKQGKVEFRGGILDGDVLSAEEASSLADLPGRQELRGMLLSVINGPARSLAGLLAAPSGALVRVIQARVDEADKTGEASA